MNKNYVVICPIVILFNYSYNISTSNEMLFMQLTHFIIIFFNDVFICVSLALA